MTVYKITTGSMARKAVLAYLWSVAADGIAHAGNGEIGTAIEASKPTVTAALKDLVDLGHIVPQIARFKDGKRAGRYLLTKSPEGD